VRIEENLHYTNSRTFKTKIFEFTRVKPQDYIIKRNKIERARERRKKANLNTIQRIVPQSIQKMFPNYFAKFQQPNNYESKKEFSENGTDNPAFKNFTLTGTNVNTEDDRDEYNIKQGTHKNHDDYETESQRGGYKTATSINNKNETDDDISSEEEDYSVHEIPPIHHIIIDCSPLNYVDTCKSKIEILAFFYWNLLNFFNFSRCKNVKLIS
jgi:hypothetical protein